MRISDWSSDVCSSDLAATFSTILDLYRDSRDLDWTMLSPAPVIAPGERTGTYRVGTDHPIGDTVSAEDFAVAIVSSEERRVGKGCLRPCRFRWSAYH